MSLNAAAGPPEQAGPISWLASVARFLDMLVRPVSTAASRAGEVILFLMMVLTATDVLLRDTIDAPILGSFDLTEFMMLMLTAFGIGYCAIIKGHINADVILTRLPRKVQAVTMILATFVSCVTTALLAWQCFVNMQQKLNLQLVSGVMHIPLFPFAGVLGAGMVLFSLVLLKDFFELLAQEVGR